MLHARGIEGTRVLQGLLSLTKKHSSESLEKACEIAASHGCYRLRTLRQLLTRQAATQTSFAFLDEHPVIRPMADYAAVVAAAHQRRMDRETSFVPNTSQEGFGRDGWAETSAVGTARAKSLAAPLSTPPGSADLSPPRPGYPSPSCSSAELGSVSPDTTNVVRDVRSSTSDSENSHE
jgi:hypothetical protein